MNGEPVFAAFPPGAAIRTDPSVGFNWDPGLLGPSAGRIARGHGLGSATESRALGGATGQSSRTARRGVVLRGCRLPER
jgi:hypothetical protein